MTRHQVGGVVLAGGLSRRMGGVEKALLTLGGQPLIAHAVNRLKPQVASLILNANGDPARFAALKLEVVADQTDERPGPLAGILTALDWFAAHAPNIETVASLPADTPFAPRDLVDRLSAALANDAKAGVAVAQSRGRRHPVIALWKIETVDTIRASLARDERKAEAMIDRLAAVAVPFADLEIGGEIVDPFFNINTPDDHGAAETMLRALDRHRGTA